MTKSEILELMHKQGEREAVEYKKRLVPQDGYMTERCYITGYNSATEKLAGLLAKAIDDLNDAYIQNTDACWFNVQKILIQSVADLEQELRKMGGE